MPLNECLRHNSAYTSEQLHTQTIAFRANLSGEGENMRIAGFYQSTADAMGVPLYVYPDGSVTNFRKVDAAPTATIPPHETWRPPSDHGLGDQSRQAYH
jgi:hypothetical protein